MKFIEKLTRLTTDRDDERSRASISRRAGLPSNAVSDYINKAMIPRVDNALRLARALGVSLDWLADDSAEWPPPSLTATNIQPAPHVAADLLQQHPPKHLQTFFQPAENASATAIAIAFNMAAGVDLPPREKAALVGELAAVIASRLTISTPPAVAASSTLPPAGQNDEPLIRATISLIRAEGTAARRHACMGLPDPIFEQLVRRIVGGKFSVKGTAEWLSAQVADAPTRSSVERFSTLVLKHFNALVRDRARREG